MDEYNINDENVHLNSSCLRVIEYDGNFILEINRDTMYNVSDCIDSLFYKVEPKKISKKMISKIKNKLIVKEIIE